MVASHWCDSLCNFPVTTAKIERDREGERGTARERERLRPHTIGAGEAMARHHRRGVSGGRVESGEHYNGKQRMVARRKGELEMVQADSN